MFFFTTNGILVLPNTISGIFKSPIWTQLYTWIRVGFVSRIGFVCDTPNRLASSKRLSKLHNKDLNVVVNGNQLNNVENEKKLLVVYIDNNLAFNKHVYAVCGNIT